MNNLSNSDPSFIASQLLALVGDIVRELHPNNSTFYTTSLDSLFDHDLGLDSLGRVELIARVEREFAVVLPENLMSVAETPRDIFRALMKNSGVTVSVRSVETIDVALADSVRVPESAKTLTDMLRWNVEYNPERPHIQFYDDYTDGEIITYKGLWDGAMAVAGGLQHHGLVPDETVALMLPTSRDYFFAFFGVVLAGGIPVPIYPPVRRAQIEDHMRRQATILSNCGASMLITVAEAKTVAHLLTLQIDSLRVVSTVGELIEAEAHCELAARRPEDLGFIQYTSGSTGDPKGVVLTHANLLANIRANGHCLQVNSTDVFVSWLPLYHDMGLIGAWLGCLYHTPRLVIMSPLSFLSRPERWLWAIHRYGGTLSAAPNFAFDLCVRRISDKDIEGLDLSRWRVVANGAESISPLTMGGFLNRFRAYGFAKTAMLPVYGLAECSVGLTFSPIGRSPRIDNVDRDALADKGRAEPTSVETEGNSSLQVVSCGLPLPRHEIRVVDHSNRELPERREGRLQFRGPSATSGYFRNPQKTADMIRGDWLETGDLAYIAAGELFITGRSKDLIIRAGRNIYPAELEALIGDLDGIRAGCVAVFGSPDSTTGTERLVVLAETRRRQIEAHHHLRNAINDIAIDVLSSPPDEIILVRPNTLLKTSSGKIRRAASRDLYEQGRLDDAEVAVWLQILRLALAGVRPQLRRGSIALKESFFALRAWAVFCGVGMFALGLTIVPLRRPALWFSLRSLTRLLPCLTTCPVVVEGELPAVGQRLVIVANHQSYLDGLLLMSILPFPAEFLVKGELKESWLLRRPLSRIGARFIERFDGVEGVEQMGDVAADLSKSYPLMVFPEGTFKRMPGVLPFHMGAFTTAVAADFSVLPIAIHGTRSVLRAHSWYPRQGKITVTIGSPMRPDQQAEPWSAALTLRDHARKHILTYCREPDLAHESNVVDLMP